MILISEAIKIIKRETFALEAETIDLNDSIGRVLAENIVADMNLPPFDRSQMDGFAVKTKDAENAPVRLKIIGESVAGRGFDGKMKSGEAVRIMTGARVPAGADAVQKVELTKENNGFIEILEPAKPKQNIVKRGEEIQKGEKIFEKGEIIKEQMVASLASFGYAKVKVFQKPKISILSTGSEIVDVSEKPEKDQIRNSNSIMLQVFAKKLGLQAEVLPLVRDDFETLKNQIAQAIGLNSKSQITNYKFENRFESQISNLKFQSENQSKTGNLKSEINKGQRSKVKGQKSQIPNPKSQILIITGGVSVGDYDFTKPALRELGAEIFFEKVSLKPGKPTVFARIGDVLIFGLPGNPVSVAVTFYLFVRHAILQMQGAKNCDLRKGFAVVSERIKGAKERDSFLPVSLAANEKGQLVIESLRFSGSSNFIAFSRADALVFVPQGKIYEKGEIAEILLL